MVALTGDQESMTNSYTHSLK